jgi:hypothetical protein
MSNIKISAIDDEKTHEANNSAGTGEAPQGKPKRIRTKPQPTAQQPPPPMHAEHISREQSPLVQHRLASTKLAPIPTNSPKDLNNKL